MSKSVSQQSPSKPWFPGKHPTYTAFRLTVNVCQDEHGRVWSDHTFASSADEHVSRTLSQGGVPQIAHALLTEAVRREAFMCAFLQMTKDPEYLARWKSASDTEKTAIEKELETAVQQVVAQTLAKMSSGAAREVLAMLAEQA